MNLDLGNNSYIQPIADRVVVCIIGCMYESFQFIHTANCIWVAVCIIMYESYTAVCLGNNSYIQPIADRVAQHPICCR